MANSRVARGRQSESIVAAYLADHGFPHAERVAASLKGADVTGTPGLAIEVKSRRGLDLPGWLKQSVKRDGLPVLIIRPDGSGPASVTSWAMVIPFGTGVELLRKAGYGTELEACECPGEID